MAKYKDEVELVISARNETAAALRQAEQQAREIAQQQAREQQRIEADARSRVEQAEQERLRRVKAAAQERVRVEEETQDLMLRAQGKNLEADLAITARSYNKRIRLALDANDLELADRIATLRDMKLAEERSATERAKTTQGIFEGGVVRSAVRSTASFGAMTLALGGVNSVAKALSGNIEDAAEAVKRLPVIGTFARELETALNLVTGIRSETEAITRINAAQEEGQRLQASLFERRLKIAQDYTSELRKQRAELAELSAAPGQRDAVRAGNEQRDLIASTQSRLADAERQLREAAQNNTGNAADQARIAKIDQELNRLRTSVGLAVTRNTADVTEAIGLDSQFNDAVRLLEQERRTLEQNIALRREAVQQSKQERDNTRQLVENEQQLIAARTAEAQRRHREEQIVKSRAEQQIAVERSAAQERLRNERLLQGIEQARNRTAQIQANERLSRESARVEDLQRRIALVRGLGAAPQNTADQNRFLTGVAERSATNDRSLQSRDDQIVSALEKQLLEAQKTVAALNQLLQQLASGPRVVGGVFNGSSN